MTYHDALAYLNSLTNYERTHQPQAMREVNLERMRLLCERLGHPQRRFRSILVAGTNGKGSICAMLYEVLRQAGLRVGLYTSPHLEDLRERIRVSATTNTPSTTKPGGTDWISRQEFAGIVQQLQPVIEELNRTTNSGPLTYFEVLTAAAFLQFAQQQMQVGVLEVGLGGRLDATNVVDQTVSVIGPIGLDHTDVLGHDLVSIAQEKAGILKSRSASNGHSNGGLLRTVVSAAQQLEVSQVFREAAREHGYRLLEYGHDMVAQVMAHRREGLRVRIRGVRGQYDDLTLALLGRHQAENAAMVIAAVEALAESGAPYAAVRAGLARVQWSGRLEVVEQRPWVVFDGAHNPQAAQSLKVALEELWPGTPIHVLIGISADKPVHALAEILGPMASSVTCTKSRHPRASDPHRLAQHFQCAQAKVTVIPELEDAYTYLRNTVKPDDLIVVTGSLFVVGELRAMMRHTQTPHRVHTRAYSYKSWEVLPCRS